MNRTDFTLIWRNLWKNSNFTVINIFGLSVSLAVGALIGLYLHFEFSFDRMNPSHGNIYRLLTTFKYPNSPESTTAMTSVMMGPYLKQQNNEIEHYLRVVSHDENFLCRSESKEITIGRSLQVDTSFFSFFNYDLLYGSQLTVFDHPANIILTKTVAEKLFDKENPVGKTLAHTYPLSSGSDTTIVFLVSGVLDKLPSNSHLQFDALSLLDDRYYQTWSEDNRWHGVVASTYLHLRSGNEKVKQVESDFPEALKKEMPNSDMIHLTLQPFSEVHLNSAQLTYDQNNYLKSDRKYVVILSLIAIFILGISSINFANLSTVLAMKRRHEVGVRKALGATGKDILWQFLGEALLMAVFAGALALLWAEILRKPFLFLLGRDLELPIPLSGMVYFAGIVLFLGLLAGIYPAVQAASYSALQAFQSFKMAVSFKRPFVQRLVIMQFVLASMLIIGSLICYQQLRFLENKDLGFQYSQVLELNIGAGNWMRSPAMKEVLATIPGVEAVSSSDNSLGTIDAQNGVLVRKPGTGKWENFPMSIIRADYNYFDLYEMKFVAGRAPSREAATNELEYVVNESFVRKIGWDDDPIGMEIMRAGLSDEMVGRVVGVIRDIHHNTLHRAIEPICIQASGFSTIISLKVNPANLREVLKQMQAVWLQHINDRPFEYRFLDAHFAQVYLSENRLGKALILASVLSILIACLGLLALSAFIINQRTREIGVRKILGATIGSIVALFSGDFLKMVLTAFVIATPLAWMLMHRWLQDFAYHFDIHWTVFVLAGLLILLIAFLTVSIQSLQAALANPVDSLRNE